MSLHATSQESEAALKRQRKNSMISSMIIGVLSVTLVMLLLSLFFLAPMLKEVPVIVTYESSTPENTELEVKKIQQETERKPTAPSASTARVITANTMSTVAVPMPDIDVTAPSLEFGSDNDFGEGWASQGAGAMGAISFFEQKVNAERIAYVIDYSASMRGAREALMREELKKSVSKLPPGIKYQMIFFAGPAWVAGDDVNQAKDRKTTVIKADGKTFLWGSGKKGLDSKGNKRKAEWMVASSSEIKKSLKLIKDTPLIYGTQWLDPLEMAMDMNPPPQIIFFMTDGTTGKDSARIAKDLAKKAKSKKIKINSVAMMEPGAIEGMKALAHGSGGEFSIVEKNGKVSKGK